MHLAIRQMEREAAASTLDAAAIAGNAADPRRGQACRHARAGKHADRLAPGGQDVLGRRRAAASRGAISGSRSPPAARLRGLDGVVGGRGQAAGDRLQLHDRPAVLAAALPGLSGATLRIFYSFMVPIFGGRLWTTLTTWSLLIPALGIGYAVQNPDTPYWIFLVLALLCGFGGGNFASSMSNIGFFFPRREGQCAGAQCRPRQSGRQRRAVRRAARHHRRRVRLRSAAIRRRQAGGGTSCGCRTPASSGCRSSRVSAFAAWFGMNDIADREGLVCRAGGDLPAQAQLDHVLALHRHLRLVHRLFGRLPLLAKTQFPDVNVLQYRLPRARWSARCRAPSTGWVRPLGRRARHLLGVHRMMLGVSA
jgi:NNP family nitrate/nitrite transporter-like MFS transporter